ncbi:hypothetical protein [Geomobilimonas luticola]|uniref:Leucine rich repeat variant n=1 Tax=Geomobilimonas luticola TaxID=1114878 RepID=A0ABS5SHA8_9BACT|nr:hypothetical protein [Geomobilimonas luticola]MBT0654047.1 hypothetical protein [Geomobilimonas luticola]
MCRVVLNVSAAAAGYAAAATPREERLRAARWEVPFAADDLVNLLLFLSYDQDDEVSSEAIKSLRQMPESVALQVADSPETPAKVIELLARLHYDRPDLATRLVSHPMTDRQTMAFLAEKGIAGAAVTLQEMPEDEAVFDEDEEDLDAETDTIDEEEEPESEEYASKYKMAQSMGVSEKIKMALTGDKEWRSILVKEPNKLVCGSVIKNPRITEAEILTLVKTGVQSDEIMRLICANREWVKNYQIRKALATNNKTPLPNALRYISTLTEKDVAAIAKSKNVSSVISTQARRILLQKQKHK